MSRFRDNENLIGQANSFLEVLEQVSRAAPLNKTGVNYWRAWNW